MVKIYYGLTDPTYGITDPTFMVSQTLPMGSHRPTIRIYNKIINKNGEFWRLCSKKITIDKN